MAKTQGPLMSMGARGSFAKGRLVFSMSHMQTIAKSWKIDKRTSTPAQRSYHAVLKEANKRWKELPEYLKDQWRTTPQNIPNYHFNSPWVPPVKGRLLFLHSALHLMNKGLEPFASPFGPEPAPKRHQASPVIFEIA